MNNMYIKSILLLLSMSVTTQLVAQQLNETKKEVSHTFFAVGNLGEKGGDAEKTLTGLKMKLDDSDKNTTLLYLGNNVSNAHKKFEKSITKIDVQLALGNSFSGNIIFLPGVNEWNQGLKDLKKQQNYVVDVLKDDKAFFPEYGCSMEREKINEDVDLILVDSQWAMQDWNEHPGINADCDIKSKTEFYVELESDIKKAEGKTVIVAMHHPIISQGTASSGLNLGINPQKTSNKFYKEFSDRLMTIARQSTNVVFLSGHDHSMQYTNYNGIPLIVSGSGAKSDKVKRATDQNFTAIEQGFSKITQYKDGAAFLEFYGVSNNFDTPIFSKEIIASDAMYNNHDYNEYETPQFVSKSIYTKEELDRTGFYKALWGEHFRDDYDTEIQIKTALLDTLYGGLTPIRKGGGHQTNSIRLEDKNGKQYALRSAKKSALRFIQYFLFKTKYLDQDVKDTYFIQLLQDYWTTANPYGSLTIGEMADAIGVLHPNPQLYYIPKQKALGTYNDQYGDNMFFIEERLSDGLGDVESLGSTDVIVGTLDLFEDLRDDREDINIDESLYIRTRLFDNIIGDWDRHADQWKWAEKKGVDGKDIYQPIPRDRDQVYSDFDGIIIGAATLLVPTLRFMQRYDEDYNYLKWFNDAGDDVDMAVLKNHTKEDWLREAKYIKENLTKDIIDNAFDNLPPEIDQAKVTRTKKALLGRIRNVESNAVSFYEYLQSCVLVVGTDKGDRFVITRLPDGKTRIEGYRMKSKGNEVFWDVTYNKEITKEIWLYGLDDKDVFEVNGEGDKPIHIKIIGGNDNDTYTVSNRKNIKVYDQKTKKNTFNSPVAKRLSDDYDLNTYYFKKHRRDVSSILPILSFDPDNGIGLGATYNYTKNSLLRNPFTDNHQLSAQFFFATQGVDINYNGEFGGVLGDFNLGVIARVSNSQYTNNFFGFGNDTQNNDEAVGLDFNRVRQQIVSIHPSLIYRGYQGSIMRFGVTAENIEVEQTEDRFIETVLINPNVFEGQTFFGAQASYEYQNFDDLVPTKGIGFKLVAGYKNNFDEEKGYGYVLPEIRFTTKLDRNARFVIATKAQVQINIGNDFEFFQAATLGDGDGLRGFRRERFSGNQSFAHSTDIRFSMGKFKNSLVPATTGLYAGFDYGRVWVDGLESNTWHTSYGGGLYASVADMININTALFFSTEGPRFVFGFAMPF